MCSLWRDDDDIGQSVVRGPVHMRARRKSFFCFFTRAQEFFFNISSFFVFFSSFLASNINRNNKHPFHIRILYFCNILLWSIIFLEFLFPGNILRMIFTYPVYLMPVHLLFRFMFPEVKKKHILEYICIVTHKARV